MTGTHLARRAARRARRTVTLRLARELDRRRRTYLGTDLVNGAIAGQLMTPDASLLRESLRPHKEVLRGVTAFSLAHRFDTLGSGWVTVRHGMSCSGVEGHRYTMGEAVTPDSDGAWLSGRVPLRNTAEARRTWRLVDAGYVPIDWQLDFKSGWRWSERTWYGDIRYGVAPGVDVKVPWELARMQHLPQLGLAALLAASGEPGFAAADVYAREFRDEVLDFVATNPPRYGVNWHVSMEVALRAVNWLVARDLFRNAGTEFDRPFEIVFARSLREHGRHIVGNLESEPEHRGNHYLADLVGLLFIAAALRGSAEADRWLAFASRELSREAGRQFLPDGGSFEASTSYHRLSAELVTCGVALLAGLRDDSAPVAPLDRMPDLLCRMAQFSIDVTKPTGRVVQVGDNDSGRVLKLVPSIRVLPMDGLRPRQTTLPDATEPPRATATCQEDHLDHRSLVAAINGLVSTPESTAFADGRALESVVVSALADTPRPAMGAHPAVARPRSIRIGEPGETARVTERIAALPESHRRTLRIDLPPGAAMDARHMAYPDFGLYILRSDRLFLSIRCGGMGRRVLTGHAHNDQLSVELSVDSEDWIRDPGTYLYTAAAERRNAYRSWTAHFVPRTEGPEPGDLRQPFALPGTGRGRCLAWGTEGFAGEWRLFGAVRLLRVVQVQESCLRIVDGAEGRALAGPTGDVTDWRRCLPAIPFSPGYGILERA